MISCFHGNYFSLSTLIDTSIIQINKSCVREMILKIEQETQYSLPLRREKIYSGVLFEFSQFKQLTLYCIYYYIVSNVNSSTVIFCYIHYLRI